MYVTRPTLFFNFFSVFENFGFFFFFEDFLKILYCIYCSVSDPLGSLMGSGICHWTNFVTGLIDMRLMINIITNIDIKDLMLNILQ